MSEVTTNDYVGYEYEDITVKSDLQAIYADNYANFGWTLESVSPANHQHNAITMKFKRDRKIQNKVELTKLQRQFDKHISEIQKLEFSKVRRASTIAYAIGLLGTVFMAGAVFAYLGGLMALTFLLAIPALIGWVASYISYVLVRRRKVAEVTPMINQQYEDIYMICKDANGLAAAA